jgi:hypothetical protein
MLVGVEGPAGELLVPMLPVLVPLLRRDGDFGLTEAQVELLMRMSAVTVDRKLETKRAKMLPWGRCHQTPLPAEVPDPNPHLG